MCIQINPTLIYQSFTMSSLARLHARKSIAKDLGTTSYTTSQDISFLTLVYLPHLIRQKRFKYLNKNDGQMKVIESILDGNVVKFKHLLLTMESCMTTWKNWMYEIDVKLTMSSINEASIVTDKTDGLALSAESLDAVVVLENNVKNIQFERQMSEKPSQFFTLTLSFLHLVILARRSKILNCLMNDFDIHDDEWIKEISINKEHMKESITEEESWIFESNCFHLAAKFHPKALHVLLSNLKNKETVITKCHENMKISPLHVATMRMDSLSTR